MPETIETMRQALVSGVASTRASLPGHEGNRTCSTLSPREVEVLELVGLGLSNAEIADCLFISPLTARVYLKRLHDKCGVEGRARLAVVSSIIFQGGKSCTD
jgi:DNA-binding CsgD family transcriptional regulator